MLGCGAAGPGCDRRMSTLAGLRGVAGDRVIDDGYVRVAGDRIAAVGSGRPRGSTTVDGAVWAVPGFVDIHVHGGGGHAYTTGDADEARRAAAFHLAHGTTTTLASL